jgi:phosphoglycolate phosphatase
MRREYARHFIEHADRVMADLTVIYGCVPEMLEALRARGFRRGIVSTKFRYRIEEILAREGLTEQVDVIVGGEDVTRHKPDPESLLLALAQLGCTTEGSIYVGDHPVDAEAAQATGMHFVATLTGTSTADAFRGFDVVATLRDLSTLPETLDLAAPHT